MSSGIYASLIGNPAYNDLYGNAVPEADAKEQALELSYDLQPGATGTTGTGSGMPIEKWKLPPAAAGRGANIRAAALSATRSGRPRIIRAPPAKGEQAR